MITPSPTSSSSSFPLLIPPHLASPSPSSYNEGIIAEDEQFFTPKGSLAPSYFEAEVIPASPTIAASEGALSDTDTDVQQPPLPEDLLPGAWVHLQENIVNHIIR